MSRKVLQTREAFLSLAKTKIEPTADGPLRVNGALVIESLVTE
jgi:hypothetical protein